MPWRVWLVWGVVAALALLGSVACISYVAAQITPAPCDDVVLTLHRTLAEQTQHQLLLELAAARRELARRPAAPAPTPPVPTVP